MGLRDYLWRKPASEDMPEIPLGEEEDTSNNQDFLNNMALQAQMFSFGNKALSTMSPGSKFVISPYKKLPNAQTVKSLLAMSGYDPEAAQASRQQEAGDLNTLRQMINVSGQPQLDLSPSANYLQSLTGRDIGYKAPQPFDTTIGKQAQLSEAIGKLESKKSEEAQKLAGIIAKLSNTVPGMTFSKMVPQQQGIAQQASFDREARGQINKLMESKAKLNKTFGNIQAALDSNDPAYIKAQGTNIARALGETGVVTDKDVATSNAGNFVKSLKELEAWWESRPISADPQSLATLKKMISDMRSIGKQVLETRKSDIRATYSPYKWWGKEHENMLGGISIDQGSQEKSSRKSMMDMFKESQTSTPTPAPAPTPRENKLKSMFEEWSKKQ